MSTIKFFSLGGQGEIGKNMYIAEVNENIYVFDAGSTSPLSQAYGYDSIIPDFKYLLENVDRVKGIFITHFMLKACGGMLRVVKDLKVPFYGSKFTIEAIKLRYLQNASSEEYGDVDLRIVSTDDELKFGDDTIRFLALSSSMPDTYGIALKTNVAKEGEEPDYQNIVYLPDFDFDLNVKGHFRIHFEQLSKIADEGVFLLLSPSTGANKLRHITTDGKLDLALRKMVAHPGRYFVLMNAEDIAGIMHLIDAAYHQKRQFTIIGAKARTLVELAMDLNYIPKYEGYYLEKKALNDENRNSDNSVIIIAGEQTEEFYALQRIAKFEDPHYTLKSTDNISILLDVPKKFEKVVASTWNYIWFHKANIIEFDTKLMPEPVLGSEDLKLLYSLLNPKYIIPISGDYRMIKAQKDLANKYGLERSNLVLLENGFIANFIDGEYKRTNDAIETGDILFGIESDSDINDYVARERQSLTQEGFIIVSGMINLKNRTTYGNVEISSSGFLPEFGQEDNYNLIRKRFKEVVEEHLKYKKVEYKEMRLNIKNELSKLILKEMKKRPIVIPVIIDIS